MAFGDELNYPLQTQSTKGNLGKSAFDANEPETALTYLGRRLDFNNHTAQTLDSYYAGEQPLAYISEVARKELSDKGVKLDALCINWPALKVNSLEERLDIVGFRTPTQANFKQGWDIWQANNMDEQSQQAHIEAFIHGRSFVVVWGNKDGAPNISVESPRQMAVYRDPRTRRPEVGLKRWVEDDGHAWAVLYYPDKIITYRSKAVNADVSDLYTDPNQITELSHVSGWDEVSRETNPLGVLPVIPLVNKPRVLTPDGVSELDNTTLRLSDAVNKLATDMMITSEFYTGPRRWATGVELEQDENGDFREFNPRAGRTWMSENPEARFGQLPEAEIEQFIKGIESLGSHLAATGSIPQHYVDPRSGQLASAESRRAAEAPLALKAKRRMKSFSGPWEDVIRLACRVAGNSSKALDKLEAVWADPEIRTEAQRIDAAVKRKALEIPLQQAWEDAGYSDAQIKNMLKLRKEENVAAPAGESIPGADRVPGTTVRGGRPPAP